MSASNSKSRLKPDALATSVVILLVMSVLQRGIGFTRGVFFCRWLSPQELGQWEMAYSFLLLAAPIVVFGVPGSLGRYVERYRQRNQLRTFLTRSIAWTSLLAFAAVGLMLAAAPLFSKLIFGHIDKQETVWLMAFCLLVIILHHFLEALFAALRMFRVVSIMHFCQSVGFAVIAISLLALQSPVAENLVVAYGVACAISSGGTLLWMRRPLMEIDDSSGSVAHGEFWPPLLRFAIWVWVANLLSNLFSIVDRYMIVHFSGMDNAEALAQVGNYHASLIVPILFVSVSELLSGVILPYLSHDWEAGRKEAVRQRVNLLIKITSLGLLAAGVVVLWTAPWLFGVAFDGKYDSGIDVLPWTLTYCVFYSLMSIALTYLWCVERTRLCSLPLGIGLVANIGLNFWLLPIYGLLGAVIATTLATIVALASLLFIELKNGMTFHRGTLLLAAVPIALCMGVVPATLALALVFTAALTTEVLLSSDDRTELWQAIHERLDAVQTTFQKLMKHKISPEHAPSK